MFSSSPQLTYNNHNDNGNDATTTATSRAVFMSNDENYDPSTSSNNILLNCNNINQHQLQHYHHHQYQQHSLMASFIDETTQESFSCTSMEIDEYSSSSGTAAAATNFEEIFYDSGISSDSSFSSCSENLYVSTTSSAADGPTNFDGILCSKKSPDLPAEYFQDLDDDERSATESLNSSWNFNSFRAEPCGRSSPVLDVSSSSQSSQPATTPISRKSSRTELKYCRKRSLRASLTAAEIFENPIKRLRPQFHRAFSTSELEISSASCNYDSSPDVTTTKYSLKVVNRIRSTDIAFGRIDSKYLADLIHTMGEKFYEQYILIDCRYPFEFNGGHIKGAINLYDPELLRSTFYPSNESSNIHKIHSKKPIFYCEFSSVRGPNMANALRELDRRLNHDNYPHIDYNEIYVLSEGYRHFYHNANVGKYCEPPSYIPMNSTKHLKELRKYPFHKKSECVGLSIRSRSTQALVQAYSANLSPCFCRSSICTCTKSLPSFQSQNLLGNEFSQISLKSPNQCQKSLISPPPFCLDESPFSSCNPS